MISMRQDDKFQGIKGGPDYRVHWECEACSKSATRWCPCLVASVSGVSPYLLEILELTSFRCNNSFTTPSWPFLAANESAVRPYVVSGMLELISSLPSSSFTMPSRPFTAANRSGVSPDWLELLGLTSFRSNSSFTTPLRPFTTADASGVRPYLVSGVSGLTSLRSKSSFATP